MSVLLVTWGMQTPLTPEHTMKAQRHSMPVGLFGGNGKGEAVSSLWITTTAAAAQARPAVGALFEVMSAIGGGPQKHRWSTGLAGMSVVCALVVV